MSKKLELLENSLDGIDHLKCKFYMNLPDYKRTKKKSLKTLLGTLSKEYVKE